MLRPLPAVVLATLVVLAGCGGVVGPAGDDGPDDTVAGDTPSLDDTINVKHGKLAVNPDLLFARVEALTERDVRAGTVVLRDFRKFRNDETRDDPVFGLLGVRDVNMNVSRPAGLTLPTGQVQFDPVDAPRAFVERRLVHEFVHLVQFRSEMLQTPAEMEPTVTTDLALAYRTVTEGAAVYVTDAYVREHMPDARLQSAVLTEAYRGADQGGTRMTLAPYVIGERYVADHVDGPEGMDEVFDPMPRSTEQILHDQAPSEEPPATLRVEHEEGDDWAFDREDRLGELFTRIALRTELSRERAAEAAAGWGNDAYLSFRSDDGYDWGAVWVFRWDSSGEAEEFAAAANTFASRRADATGRRLNVVRLSPDTVALVAGTSAFVNAASVSDGGGTVTVTVGDSASLRAPAANATSRGAGRPARA